MRIYLPATDGDLASHPDTALDPGLAFAATPALAAALPGEDEEGVEFSAFLAAVDASLVLLSVRDGTAARRVVISAEVPADKVMAAGERDPAAPGELALPEEQAHHGKQVHPGEVGLRSPVPWDAVVAIHVDEPDAAADVERAVAGDAAAAERLAERDLLWFDASELPTLAPPAAT